MKDRLGQSEDRDTILAYFYSELFCKSFTALLFLVGCLVRYHEIKDIGFSKTTVYSRLYKFKLFSQYLQVAIEITIILLYFLEFDENGGGSAIT